MSILPRLLLLLLGLFLAGSAAAVEVRDTTPGGAAIVMSVPDGWRAGGPLIVYNHGYGFSLDDSPGLGPLASVWLAQGYAIAASAYRERGWALFSAMDDNAELVAAFTGRFGPPGALFAVGGSMGGLISLKMLDDARFAPQLAGVYALCAPADAQAAWNEAFDLRLAYDAICGDVSGGDLPRGDAPLTWAQNLNDLPTSLHDFDNSLDVIRTLLPVTICTGLGLPDNLRLNSQKDRLAKLMRYAQVTDENFLETQLGYAIYGLSEIVRAPEKLDSRNAFDSRYLGPVDFSTASIDSRIPAIAPDPFAAYDFAKSSVPGVVQNTYPGGGPHVPVLALYTSRDELVRPFHAGKVAGTNRAAVFVDEASPTHCGFTQAEAVAGWTTLARYAAHAPAISTPQAAASLVASECTNAIALGAQGPCRVRQPGGTADDTGAPRPRVSTNPTPGTSAQVDAQTTGLWFDPARSGEGFLIETYAADNRALAVWFTYPPVGAAGSQRFLIGTGTWVGNGITIDPVIETSGARFGAAFDPADVVRVPWGRFTFAFDGIVDATVPRPGAVRWAGPTGYGTGELPLVQLTQNTAPGAAAASTTAQAFAGAFYNRARDGEGVFFTQDWRTTPGVTQPSIVALWFTYDANGRQMWLIGQGSGARGPYTLQLLRPVGTRFGANFDAGTITRQSFGTATLAFADCDHLTLSYDASAAGFGTGTLSLERLTRPIGTESCPAP